MKPFRVDVPEEVLVDLRVRLERTRWVDDFANEGWQYGTNTEYLKELVAYWIEAYDWRKHERAIESILRKSVQSLRASAFYCFLCGVISLAAGIVAYYTLPSNFLIGFCGACGIALIFSGIWYTQVARTHDSAD